MAEAIQKTVTFNAGSPTAAMSSGVRLAVYGSGIPAAILLTYSGIATIGLAVGLSPTIPDAIFAALVAGSLSVAVGALPILARIMEMDEKAQKKLQKNGDEGGIKASRIARWCFWVCFAASAAAVAAHFDFTRKTNFGPAPPSAASVPDIDPRRINTFRAKSFRIRTDESHYAIVTGDDLLKQTSNCQTFEYDDERGRCQDLAYPYSEQQVHTLLERLSRGPADAGGLRDFVPEWAIPWLRTGNVAFLHLSALLLGVGLAIVCAGSYAALTRTAPTQGPMPVVTPVDTKTPVDPDASFKMWWSDCVVINPASKRVSFKDIIFPSYEDYCWANFGKPPLDKTTFSDRLKKHAATGTEGVVKRHSGGTVYDGIQIN